MRILFVCTGNVCRSPMAEGLFREMTRYTPHIQIDSAGMGAMAGQMPSRNAQVVMNEMDIDISEQRSQPISDELIASSDYILVMTYGHLDTLLMYYPQATEKTFLIREFTPNLAPEQREVSDPIGGPEAVYRICRNQIFEALKHFLITIQDVTTTPVEGIPSTEQKSSKRIALASARTVQPFKDLICTFLEADQYDLIDFGPHAEESGSTEPSFDMTPQANKVAQYIQEGKADLGILISSQNQISPCQATHPHIRTLTIEKPEDFSTVHLSPKHNDANILCLVADKISPEQAKKILSNWIEHKDLDKDQTIMETPKTIMPSSTTASLSETDYDIFSVIEKEKKRQFSNIELIASENFTSRAVMEAQGSCLTNKYAEGYPGKRWYGGCEEVDKVEEIAIERAKELFAADHVNVQPHSGSQANMAVYFSVLEPGDKILTMDLAHGGHLTHGHKMNFSGKLYDVLHYGVSQKNECIDYEQLAITAKEFQPKMITVGASAYSRTIHFDKMAEIAKSIGAYLFADIAHISGLVAAGVHPSPVGLADFVTTTTHKTLRGPRGGMIMCKADHAKAIDSLIFPGSQGGPLMHVIAAKAVCYLEALQPQFKSYQKQVVRNAKALSEGMKKNGYRIVSDTTENHVMLIDLQEKGLTGKEVQEALDLAGITVNKNAIPFDTQSPFKSGGIRLGTPAVTTRGMKEDEMFDIANWIHSGIENRNDPNKLADIQQEVIEFTSKYPLPY